MFNRLISFLPGIFCLFLIAVVFPAATATAGTQSTTNRIIVKFKTGANGEPSRDKLNVQNLRAGNRVSLQHIRTLGNKSRVYSLGKFQKLDDVKAIATELMQRDDVEYAEPDVRRFSQFAPNDPEFTNNNQWYLREPAGGIRAEPAWDITRGDSNTVIAVIDSGILPHGDLVRVLQGYDFISEDPPGAPSDFFTANDGDGRDDDPTDPGDSVLADECSDGEPAANSSWHGTLLTGIMVAETDNGNGISGIDHRAFVLPLRALGKCGGFISDIAEAIRWAAGLDIAGVPGNPTRAGVINLSLGAMGECSQTEQEAINAAIAENTVVVVAAGNEGGFIEDSAPANCDNVIAVTATTQEGGETCYTNVGAGADIAAPGGNASNTGDPPSCTNSPQIRSTSNTGADAPVGETIAAVAGTSISAAMVTGAVALMKSIDSNLTPSSIEAILKTTARVFPDGTTDGFRDCEPENCGAGILDLQGAVVAAGNGGFDSTPNPFSFTAQTGIKPDTPVESNSVTITGIDIPTTISVSDGTYSIEDSAFTKTDGVITTGQSVKLRATSSSSFSKTTRATLTIGGVSADFSVSTLSGGGGGGGGGSLSWLVLLAGLSLLFRNFINNKTGHNDQK